MADFRWKDRESHSGTLRARDRRDALRSLASRGIEPTELVEDKPSAARTGTAGAEAASDLVSRLKPLLKSGLTAGEALRTLSKRSADPNTASLAKEIWQETASGIPLHASVGVGRGFPSHASALLRAGEAAGDLGTAFESLDSLMRRRKQARKAALAAIAYPALIACMAYAVLVLFVTLLLPKLEEVAMAASQNPGMPSGSWASTFARASVYLAPALAACIALPFLWVGSSRASASSKARKDSLMLNLPVIGPLISLTTRAETCAVLASLLRGGVPLSEAMGHAAEACPNLRLKEMLRLARSDVAGGERPSTALLKRGFLPARDADALAAGEESGAIADSLAGLAAALADERDAAQSSAIRMLAGGLMVAAFLAALACAIAVASALASAGAGMLSP
jgi:type II secretory pathway component PulF